MPDKNRLNIVFKTFRVLFPFYPTQEQVIYTSVVDLVQLISY